MSNNKLSKYLHKPYTEERGKKHTPQKFSQTTRKSGLKGKFRNPQKKKLYGGPKAARRGRKATSGLNQT
jgi:hypothetical protein